MAAPTNYVLTGYKTEAAAKAGDVSTAYQVDSNGHLDGHTGQPAGYPFWTHTRYWYRIEANEPVKEFYIDWDDGEDNDPKGKANYTSIKLDTPAFVGITSHIYTGNSSYTEGDVINSNAATRGGRVTVKNTGKVTIKSTGKLIVK